MSIRYALFKNSLRPVVLFIRRMFSRWVRWGWMGGGGPLRLSRESGNPVGTSRCCVGAMDSRFRGKDAEGTRERRKVEDAGMTLGERGGSMPIHYALFENGLKPGADVYAARGLKHD